MADESHDHQHLPTGDSLESKAGGLSPTQLMVKAFADTKQVTKQVTWNLVDGTKGMAGSVVGTGVSGVKATAAATKPRVAVTKKAKFFKQASKTKDIKNLKGAAKLDALASKWNAVLYKKRVRAARKVSKKTKKVAKRK